MHALVRFSHIAAGNTFTTTEIHACAMEALETTGKQYSLSSLRYDLSKFAPKDWLRRSPARGVTS